MAQTQTLKNVKSVMVTGASGLLGRAVLAHFVDAGWRAVGLAFSRAHKHANLVKVDIRDEVALEKAVQDFKPSVIIHCAAEKSPDVVEKAPEDARTLNVEATKNLAVGAAKNGALFIYISTDSVFDGTNPPYAEDASTHPVNKYGETKLAGEIAALSQKGLVLRIPFLYGPVDDPSESSVATVFAQVLDGSKPVVISDYDFRYPTHVDDIAKALLLLATTKLDGKDVHGIYHWSGKDRCTKYQMAVLMANAYLVPFHHISSDPNPPASGAPRAYDPALSCDRLRELGAPEPVRFLEGMRPVLDKLRT